MKQEIKKGKQGLTLLLALVLSVVFFSCALGTGGSEDGGISLSFPAGSKALGGGTEARVWVYSNNILVPNSSSVDYYRTVIDPNAGGSLTIDDLPPGEAYRFVVAAGTISGTTFTPTAFGTSPLFSIQTGVETSVAIELKEIEISTGLPNTELKSVVVSGGSTITVAAVNEIYEGAAVDLLSPLGWSSVPINSLSLTADSPPDVLVNTTAGVRDTSGILIGGSWGETPSILQSGGMTTGSIYFYQAEKELGGSVEGGNWNQVELDIPVAGKPVLDLLVKEVGGTVYGYFATRVVGAFRIGSADIDSIELEDILSGSESSPITFFGEGLPLIQAFGNIEGKDDLYLGTKNGVYKTSLSSPKTTTPTLISDTKGLDVTKIVVQGSDQAFLTARELVVLKGGTRLYKMPFLTSTVGTLTDVAWQGTNLIVTGTSGICSVPTADLDL
ncbi:MAG: hypothetical protein KA771_03445 [Spirochaetales bacterium]|nr:hypothetical protein [Spirochaetales bacterium]